MRFLFVLAEVSGAVDARLHIVAVNVAGIVADDGKIATRRDTYTLNSKINDKNSYRSFENGWMSMNTVADVFL